MTFSDDDIPRVAAAKSVPSFVEHDGATQHNTLINAAIFALLSFLLSEVSPKINLFTPIHLAHHHVNFYSLPFASQLALFVSTG